MTRCLLAFASVIALGVATFHQSALASTIGVGLDWRKNVFVQESWKDGKASYAIANKTDTDQTIVVSGYRNGKKLAGPWLVAAHSVIHVDANPLIGNDLIRFNLEGGDSLGLLQSPIPPTEFPKAMIVTYDGLNGSGGRHKEAWVEQDLHAFPSESLVELRLRIPGNSGPLLIRKGNVEAMEILCETLNVIATNGQTTVDVPNPRETRDSHLVVLKFKAPPVTQPTMLTVDTWLWDRSNKSGHGITRGVVIEPAAR